MNLRQPISQQVLHRLPYYLQNLRRRDDGAVYISAPVLAAELQLNEVQVRKDLAAVSSTGGRPKMGYEIHTLIRDIEEFLGFRHMSSAVLVGTGSLGRALLEFKDFAKNGLRIEAAFDQNPEALGRCLGDQPVRPMETLVDFCRQSGVQIGIITVPVDAAQEVCDMLVEGGVKAIWNFAPIHLNAPRSVVLQNDNMVASFAVLSRKLHEAMLEG